MTNTTARAKVTVVTIIVTGACVGGLTKFGITPGGGGLEGIFVRSIPARSMVTVELASLSTAFSQVKQGKS